MTADTHALYGSLPLDLIEDRGTRLQCSPQVPGATALANIAVQSLADFIVHAPPGTIERRCVLALALRALKSGATLTAFAANTKGGTRIAAELEAFGCAVATDHRRRHQIVRTARPEKLLPAVDDAINAGAPRLLPELQLWSQPGLFNWDRIDPGSQLLLDHLPPLSGHGADLGCGIGVLARAVRATSHATHITLIDIDQRALDMARRNVPGDGVTTLWADVRSSRDLPTGLDFIVTNPPFHDGGDEDKALGQAFITKAALMLKPGGVLWLTANRHLPYEATLKPLFETVALIAQKNGFKIYAAHKAAMPARTKHSKPRK
ncbi:MAG: class I SAM-dependent methyltransferase [Hyphomicrobium sp.]|nr:class I SAM-dependent methyltransferase [Hyphomicrobium sp.]